MVERTKKEVGREVPTKGSLQAPLRRPAEKGSRPEEDTDEEASKRRVQGPPTPTPSTVRTLQSSNPETEDRWCLNPAEGNETKFSTLGRADQSHTTPKRNLDVRFYEPTAEGAVIPF